MFKETFPLSLEVAKCKLSIVDPWTAGLGHQPLHIENPCITLIFPKLNCSAPLVSVGGWFSDPLRYQNLQMLKSLI